MKLFLTLLLTLTMNSAFAGGGGASSTTCYNKDRKEQYLLHAIGSFNWFSVGDTENIKFHENYGVESSKFLVVESTDTSISLQGNIEEEKILLTFPTGLLRDLVISITQNEESKTFKAVCDFN